VEDGRGAGFSAPLAFVVDAAVDGALVLPPRPGSLGAAACGRAAAPVKAARGGAAAMRGMGGL
jgi:hypothetical protein